MSTDRWSQIEELYHATLEQPAAERSGFLERMCAGDLELRREIEELLKTDERAEGFLSSPSWKTTAVSFESKPAGHLKGEQISHYEIISLVGAGGMGEVYKARDTRLDRTVAIKVLPSHVAADRERKKRFEREARAVSQFNHPHICTLYDIGQHNGLDYLVMEYLEGQTLAQRLEHGPLRFEEALKVAIEIGDALDKAHRHGVTHRDLKPGNVMLSRNGAKLLDFGLAKLKASNSASESALPAADATGAGMILGTLQYIAPEQLEGKEADARTDIFAFGAVLYEMLSGAKAFQGQSQPALIAAIMSSQPEPLSKRDPTMPPAIDHVLRRCLAKDPENRWQTAHDLVAELRWIVERGRGVAEQTSVEHRWPAKLGWIAALAAGAAAIWLWLNPPAAERPLIVSSLLAPEGSAYDLVRPREFIAWPALSPDGKRIVFGARSADGKASQLWVRELDSSTAWPLPGTEAATFPFWSPDGRYVGFSTNSDLTLKKIDILGGPPVTITTLTSTLRGASWSTEGVIVYSQVGPTVEGRSLLMQVAHTGGESSPATALADKGPHRFPWFLPDGRHFLFVAQRSSGNVVLVGSLDDAAAPGKAVAKTETNVIYSQGHLLYVRRGTLVAQPFDLRSLETTGDAVAIADRIPTYLQPLSAAVFSASASGLLAYPGSATGNVNSSLVWKDRSGRQIGTLDNGLGRLLDIQLSPDKKSLLVSLQERNTFDLWIYDVAQRRRSPFTSDQDVEPNTVWTADGKAVIWRTFGGDLSRKAFTGGKDEVLFQGPGLTPRSVSPDGKVLLYTKAGIDIWALPLAPDQAGNPLKPREVIGTPATEDFAQFSPDGKWVAFISDEPGRPEAYVIKATGLDGKRQVSSGGASHVRWRSDGRELYYVTPDGNLMAAEILVHGETLAVGRIRHLFGGVIVPPAVPGPDSRRAGGTAGYLYDVSLDGQSFIVAQAGTDMNDAVSPPLTLVENWTGLVKAGR